MSPRVAAVIPAAGAGTRLGPAGPGEPKALRRLAGRTLLEWSVRAVSPQVDHVVIAAPQPRLDLVADTVQSASVEITVVPGGATRQESVRRALEALPPDTELVLVHDAARPLVPEFVVERVLSALRAGASAVVPAVPLSDALRQVGSGGSSAHLDRSAVRGVQTPQGFRVDVLLAAHRAAENLHAVDDAVLVERCGIPVQLVEGSELAFKITRPLDLAVAEAVVAARGADARFSAEGQL